MRKMRIFQSKELFFLDDGKWPKPLPPNPFIWEGGEAELIVRLHSTHAGNAAWWEAGAEARKALNAAPYQPMLRAVVDWFVWSPPETRDNPYKISFPQEVRPNFIYQGGSEVTNFMARVVRPLPDPAGDKLREIVEEASKWSSVTYEQGQLKVSYLPPTLKEGEEQIFPYAGSGRRWFFNHFLSKVNRFAWRAYHGVAYAVVVGFPREEIYILSPDHPDNSIHLAGGNYLLSHPLPSRQVDVD
jgi:hypothetical protein